MSLCHIVESKTMEMIIFIVLERKNFCIVNQCCYNDIDLIDYYDVLRKGSGRKRRRTFVSVINIETKNNEKILFVELSLSLGQ